MKKLFLTITFLVSITNIFASDILWLGSINNDWHNGENWQGNAAPTSGNTAVFDASSTVSAVISNSISVKGIRIESTYSGTISQTNGATITIGSNGFTQSGGAFLGGASAITITGDFHLSDGSFTATSGALKLSGESVYVTGGTFLHNSGTIYKTGGGAQWSLNQPVYNLEIDTLGNFTTHELTVLGDVVAKKWNSHHGAMKVAGNYQTLFNIQSTSTGKVVFNGSGNQTLSANGGVGCISSVEVNKSGGVLTVSDIIEVRLGWTNVSSGAQVDLSDAEIRFTYQSDVVSNGMVFHNVVLACPGWLRAVDTMKISGLAKFKNFSVVHGLIETTGDVELTNTSQSTSSATLSFVGNGNQSLSANGSYGVWSKIKVQKSGGVLTVSDKIKLINGFEWISGAVDTSGSTFVFYSGSQTINAEGVNFHDVEISLDGSLTLARPLKVDGNLLVSKVNALSPERIEIKGNYTNNETFFWGNGVETYFTGAGNQTVSIAGSVGLKKSLHINKSAGVVSLVSDLHLSSGLQNIYVNSGTLDLNGFNLTLGGSLKNSDTVKLIGSEAVTLGALDHSGQGTVIYTGAGPYGSLALGDDYYHLHIAGDVTQDAPLHVFGDLHITGTLNSAGHNLLLAGNFNNAGTYISGSNSFYLIGTHQTIFGANSFHDLIKRNNTNASLTFPAATTQSVAGTLELYGTEGTLLTLKSSTANSVWTINHTGSINRLGYLNISDSTSVSILDAKSNSVDAGNNTNWVFNSVNTLVWTGAADLNFSNPNNWVGLTAPNSNDLIEFLSGNDAVNIDIDANVAGIVLGASFSGSVTLAANKNLNVGYSGMTISGGTFNGNTKTITSTGDLVISSGTFNSSSASIEIIGGVQISGGTLNSSSTSFKVGGSWVKTGGIFNALGPVTFNGFGGQTISAGGTDAGSDFTDVNVSFGTLTVSSALKVNGNLIVNAGKLKSHASIQLAGNLSNNGGYINDQAGASWVLNGINAQSFKVQNHNLKSIHVSNTSALVTFLDEVNAEELVGDAGSSLVIEKGKFIVLSTLTLNGTLAQPIQLKSSIAQQNARIIVSGVQTLSYVDVRGIDGQYGPALDGTNNCVDLGYNINWLFPDNSGKPEITVTPEQDVFENSVNITMSSTGASPVIYYTLDGSTPTLSSPVYTAPLNITATTTIKAISVDGADTSVVFSKVYQSVQSAVDDGLVYPVKSYGLGALIFLGDVRRFEGQAYHVGPDGIMNTPDDYRLPEFDKYINWSATNGTILKIVNTGGAVFYDDGKTTAYTVTLSLGQNSFTGCNNSTPIRDSAYGCPHFGTPDNTTNVFPYSVEYPESVCLPQAVLSLPTLGSKVVLNIVRDAGFYNAVPFGIGRAGRMSGFHELKEISESRVNILFMNEQAGGWFPFDSNGAGKYYRDGGNQGYAEKIIESNALIGYKYTDPKGNVLVFKSSAGTNYYRVTESINTLGQKITFDYQSASFLVITDASGNRYEITAENVIDSVNQISQIVTKPFGSTLSKTWTYEYSANGSVSSQLFVDLHSSLGYGEFKYESDIHGNPTMFQDYKGYQYLNEFDDVWRNTKSILPTGDFTSKSYSGKNGSYDVKVTDNKGLLTTIYRNQTPSRILTTKIITPDSIITVLNYNAKGFVDQKVIKKSSIPSDDIILAYEYDLYNFLIKETLIAGAYQIVKNENVRDVFGNIIQTIDSSKNKTIYTYLPNSGLLESVTKEVGVLDHTYKFEYNASGGVTAFIDASGFKNVFEYDQFNNILKQIDPTGSFYKATYDSFGNKLSSSDKYNNTTIHEFDKNNRVLKSTDTRNFSKAIYYDGNSNVVSFENELGEVVQKIYNSINIEINSFGQAELPPQRDCGRRYFDESEEESRYEFDWTGQIKFLSFNKFQVIEEIKPLNLGCSKVEIVADSKTKLVDYEFQFEMFAGVFALKATRIIDINFNFEIEQLEDYKIYDIAYLDSHDTVLYIDRVQIDMASIKESFALQTESLQLTVISNGPEAFNKMKFVLIEDGSLDATLSTQVNLESNNHMYSQSKMVKVNSNKKISKTRERYKLYKLEDYQIYPPRVGTTGLDIFGNEFPMLDRNEQIKRIYMMPTGFSLLTNKKDGSETSGDRDKYDAFLSFFLRYINGDLEFPFLSESIKHRLVVYNLAKYNDDDEDLPYITSADADFENLTEDTEFHAYIYKEHINYDYVKVFRKENYLDIKNGISTFLNSGESTSILDHAFVVARTRVPANTRQYVDNRGYPNSQFGGVYFDTIPRLNYANPLDDNVIPHELCHLLFRLDDEYQGGGSSGRPNTDNLFNKSDWGDLKWARWIDFEDFPGSNTSFDNDNLILLTQTQMDTYLGNYNAVLAFPINVGDPKYDANAKNFSPCATCLLRTSRSRGLCIICKEAIYNDTLGKILLNFTPTSGMLLGSTRKADPQNLNQLDLNTITPIFLNKPLVLSVHTTDYLVKNFDNLTPMEFTYRWFREDSHGSTNLLLNSKNLVLNFEDLTQDETIYICRISFGSPNIKVNSNENLSYSFSSFQYEFERSVYWKVVRDNAMTLNKNTTEVFVVNNIDDPIFFTIDLSGFIQGANLEIITPFVRGSLDAISTIENMIYKPNVNYNFVGIDTCTFKLTNSKNYVVHGVIKVNHTTISPQIFPKEIYVQKNSKGYYDDISIELLNGIDYISKNSWETIKIGTVGQGKIVKTKNIRPGPNSFRFTIRPNKSAAGSDVVSTSIYNFETESEVTSNITIFYE